MRCTGYVGNSDGGVPCRKQAKLALTWITQPEEGIRITTRRALCDPCAASARGRNPKPILVEVLS